MLSEADGLPCATDLAFGAHGLSSIDEHILFGQYRYYNDDWTPRQDSDRAKRQKVSNAGLQDEADTTAEQISLNTSKAAINLGIGKFSPTKVY